LRTLASVFSAQ